MNNQKIAVLVAVLFLQFSISAAESADNSSWGVNVQQVSEHVLSAGALEPDKIVDLAHSGVVAVVNLRFPGESKYKEAPDVRAAGMDYISYPMKGEVPKPVFVAKFSSLIEKYEGQDILVHCASGNRVSVLWGAHLLDKGMALNDVLQHVKLAATRKGSIAAIREYARLHHADR